MQKVILITGVSSGFGKATAEMLRAKGHIIYGTSRNMLQNNNINNLVMDVTKPETIKQAVAEIMAKEGRIDVLINNAGMGIGGAIELATEEEIQLQMGTNFRGMANVCREVLPVMRRQRSGKIINISSIGGVMGLPFQGWYSASKFAIEGYSEALAAEVRQFGIRVSLVEPGDFATNFTASRRNSEATMQNEDYRESYARSLAIIEKEENGGLQPSVLAKKICKIVDAKKPRLRYVVANFEQKLSVLLKRIVPGNFFVWILRNYYKV